MFKIIIWLVANADIYVFVVIYFPFCARDTKKLYLYFKKKCFKVIPPLIIQKIFFKVNAF